MLAKFIYLHSSAAHTCQITCQKLCLQIAETSNYMYALCTCNRWPQMKMNYNRFILLDVLPSGRSRLPSTYAFTLHQIDAFERFVMALVGYKSLPPDSAERTLHSYRSHMSTAHLSKFLLKIQWINLAFDIRDSGQLKWHTPIGRACNARPHICRKSFP